MTGRRRISKKKQPGNMAVTVLLWFLLVSTIGAGAIKYLSLKSESEELVKELRITRQENAMVSIEIQNLKADVAMLSNLARIKRVAKEYNLGLDIANHNQIRNVTNLAEENNSNANMYAATGQYSGNNL